MRLVRLFIVTLATTSIWAADPDGETPHEILEVSSAEPTLAQIYEAYEKAHLDWAYIDKPAAQRTFRKALSSLIADHSKRPGTSKERLHREDYERIVKYAPTPTDLVPALKPEFADAALERLSEISGLFSQVQHRRRFVERLADTGTMLSADIWKELARDLDPETSQRLRFLEGLDLEKETPHHRVMAMLQFEPSAGGLAVVRWQELYKPYLQNPSARFAADPKSKNYYERLGLPPWATGAEIDSAYQRTIGLADSTDRARALEAWVGLNGKHRTIYDRSNYRLSRARPELPMDEIVDGMVRGADSIAVLKAVQEWYRGIGSAAPDVVNKFRELVKKIGAPGALQAYMDYHVEMGRPPESWELDEIQKQLGNGEIDSMNQWISKDATKPTEPSDLNRRWLRLLSFTHGTDAHLQHDKLPFHERSKVENEAAMLDRWAKVGGRAALAGYYSDLANVLNRRATLETSARPPASVERRFNNWYLAEWQAIPSIALLSAVTYGVNHPTAMGVGAGFAGAAAAMVVALKKSYASRWRYSLFHSQNQEELKKENAKVGVLKAAVENLHRGLNLPSTDVTDPVPSPLCVKTYEQLALTRK